MPERDAPVPSASGKNSPLFGIAPDGVYPAAFVTKSAVSSYLAISPLPMVYRSIAIGGIFSAALSSRHRDWPLTSILPYGARTFLPHSKKRATAVIRPAFSTGKIIE